MSGRTILIQAFTHFRVSEGATAIPEAGVGASAPKCEAPKKLGGDMV